MLDVGQQIAQRKRNLVLWTGVILAALCTLALVGRLFLGLYHPSILAMLALCIVTFCWCTYFVHCGGPVQWPAALLLLCCTLMLMTIGFMNGGFSSPPFIYLTVIPLLATLMIGPMAGVGALVSIVLCLLAMLVMLANGFEFPTGPARAETRELLQGFNLLVTIALIGWIGWHYARSNDEMSRSIYQLATRDYLTGLANRRVVDSTLTAELSRAQREGGWISYIIADVDHFKQFNDEFGHNAGDLCLQGVAQVLQSLLLRASDLAGRYGGEEFVAILPGTDPAQAALLASRICSAVADAKVTLADGSEQGVTITLGVASLRTTGRIEAREIMELADRALYSGKSDGRNRVRCAVHPHSYSNCAAVTWPEPDLGCARSPATDSPRIASADIPTLITSGI